MYTCSNCSALREPNAAACHVCGYSELSRTLLRRGSSPRNRPPSPIQHESKYDSGGFPRRQSSPERGSPLDYDSGLVHFNAGRMDEAYHSFEQSISKKEEWWPAAWVMLHLLSEEGGLSANLKQAVQELFLEKPIRFDIFLWLENKNRENYGVEIRQAQINHLLGYCLEKGKCGVLKNEAAAVKRYFLSAQAKYAPGQVWLGGCFDHGIGLAINADTALLYYQLAAEQASGLGQFEQGMFYMYNKFLQENELNFENFGKGMDLLKLAADQGHAAAQEVWTLAQPLSNDPAAQKELIRNLNRLAEGGNRQAIARLNILRSRDRRGGGASVSFLPGDDSVFEI